MDNTGIPDHFQLLKPGFEWQSAVEGAITQDEYVDLCLRMGQIKRRKSSKQLDQQCPLISQISLAFSAAQLFIDIQDPTTSRTAGPHHPAKSYC